jgi:DUF971 family protein
MDAPDQRPYIASMRPTDLQHIGNQLAIRWDDGSESYIGLEVLRRRCPCAGCRGEVDIMGQLHGGAHSPASPLAFQLRRLVSVGSYAIQPEWADGHATGLYTFEYLRRIAESPVGPGA